MSAMDTVHACADWAPHATNTKDKRWFSPPNLGTYFGGNITIRNADCTKTVGYTEEISPDMAAAVADKLTLIRTAFDLPTAWLAEILLVERQTLYGWMSGHSSNSRRLRQNNETRLNSLLRLTEYWRSLSKVRFSKKHALRVIDRKRLLDILIENDLDEPFVHKAILIAESATKPHELTKPLSSRLYRAAPQPSAIRANDVRRRASFLAQEE